MFDPRSRYAPLETATYVGDDGRQIAYKRRRFLPRGDELQLVAEITVSQGERLDRLAARLLGDPEQFWRICDANTALDPLSLTSQAGRVVRVASPQLPGR
jgi:hypothetical protein